MTSADQVTHYICGGISITFAFDHALCDASAFDKFPVSRSEIAQKKPISCMPDHRRSLRARYPPTYHPTLDQTFVKCTTEEIINTPTTRSCSSASIILMSPASIGCNNLLVPAVIKELKLRLYQPMYGRSW
ncbi:hypothetical protein Peur_020412 [Populus x canadensis]